MEQINNTQEQATEQTLTDDISTSPTTVIVYEAASDNLEIPEGSLLIKPRAGSQGRDTLAAYCVTKKLTNDDAAAFAVACPHIVQGWLESQQREMFRKAAQTKQAGVQLGIDALILWGNNTSSRGVTLSRASLKDWLAEDGAARGLSSFAAFMASRGVMDLVQIGNAWNLLKDALPGFIWPKLAITESPENKVIKERLEQWLAHAEAEGYDIAGLALNRVRAARLVPVANVLDALGF